MCECMSFPRGSNKVLLTYLLTYLLTSCIYFLPPLPISFSPMSLLTFPLILSLSPCLLSISLRLNYLPYLPPLSPFSLYFPPMFSNSISFSSSLPLYLLQRNMPRQPRSSHFHNTTVYVYNGSTLPNVAYPVHSACLRGGHRSRRDLCRNYQDKETGMNNDIFLKSKSCPTVMYQL